MDAKILIRFFLVSAIICSCRCVSECAIADAGEISRPKPLTNIILITVSTLRADHVRCLDCQRDTTPEFDQFSKENILFRNAFAASSWTTPAHGSIFTSLYPSAHGAVDIDKVLAPDHYTLAEILGDMGYYCVGFCCNPRLDSAHGFAQGFDFYDDYSSSLMLSSMSFENEESIDINKKRTNDLINDAAVNWLKNNTHNPFFIFLHYYDNHWDYLPPSPYDKLYDPNYNGVIDGNAIAREPLYSNPPAQNDIKHIIALYDGEVRQTDTDLGEILKFLKEKGLLDTSMVIITGDHGEQFYEHGHTSHHGIFDELIHVPLAISMPKESAKKKVVDSLVSSLDILPTILDFLEIPLPNTCQGRSLKPLIDGRADRVNDFIFAEYTGGAVPDCLAVRSEHYKYVEENGKCFVYDLLKDPLEQQKIFQSDFTAEINQQLASFKDFLRTKALK